VGSAVVDHRARVVASDPAAAFPLGRLAEHPGLMDVLRWNAGQLRAPPSDVVPVWIEALALEDGIEDPKEGLGIGAGAGHPLPPAIVIGQVAVEQTIHEDVLARPPIDAQVFHEKGRDDEPSPIRQPCLLRQLPHRRIDDGVPGETLPPGAQGRGAVVPGEAAKPLVHWFRFESGQGGQQLPVEIAPGQLPNPGIAAGSLMATGDAQALADGHHAKSQKVRDACRGLAIEAIAGAGVPRQAACRKSLQPDDAGGVPRFRDHHPVLARQFASLRQGVAVDRLGPHESHCRRGSRPLGRQTTCPRSVKRGEDLKRPRARKIAELRDDVILEGLDPDAGRPQRGGDPRITPGCIRLVVPVEEDAGGALALGDVPQHACGVATPDQELRPALPEVGIERPQSMAEEVEPGGARVGATEDLWVQHENGNDGPGAGSGTQRGVIGQSQVPAKPMDDGGHRSTVPTGGQPRSNKGPEPIMLGMPRGYARYVLAVMVGINFLNYLDRYILPVVASKIQSEFRLSDSAVGGLGTAFLLVYAVAAVPFGIWADRGIRRTVVGVGVTIWSIATLFTGLARSYTQLFLARAVLGIGEASYYPAGTSLLGDYFGKDRRGRAMSIWGAGTAVGIAVGFAGGGIVASRFGWRAAFYLTAIPGLIFAVLAFTLREPLRGAAEEGGPHTGSVARISVRRFFGLLAIPSLRATIAAETVLFFVLGGAAFWLPEYLHRQFALGTAGAGTLAGGVLVLGGLMGTLSGGVLADRWGRRRGRAMNLPIGIGGFLLGAVFVTLALVSPTLPIFVPMFLLGVAALYLYSGPYTAIKQNVVLPTVRASAVTLSLLIEHLFGDSYAPLAIGKLSDAIHSLRLALLLLLPILLLVAAAAAATGLKAEDADGRTMTAEWARSAPRPPDAAAG
jgi:predicted MFS family arabinose efflux permease